MADEPKYIAIYHSDHDGEPLALIRTDLPGNHATEMIRAARMSEGRVEIGGTNSAAFKRNEGVAELFTAGPPPATPTEGAPGGSTADPDALLRAEIRMRLDREDREKRVEHEVRKEMAETKADERKVEAKA